MVQLFNLPRKWYRGQRVVFDRYELNQILSLYGVRVSKGEWRDYAIDSTSDTAMFSIFKTSNEKPLFVISKVAGGSFRKNTKFIVSMEGQTIKKGNTILEALEIFEELDKNKKTTKARGKNR